MFQIVYSLGLALIILTALAVFYCVGHAYYQDFKEAPQHKRSAKLMWSFMTVFIGIVLIVAGQFYAQNSDYVQSLHKAWASFEGNTYETEAETIEWPAAP